MRDRRRERSRDRGYDRPPRRQQTPPEERELARLQRDARTVFAYDLPTSANEMDLFRHFSSAGRVADIRIIRDKGSVRSRGVAYIEMGDMADVPSAIALSGTELMGSRIGVKVSEPGGDAGYEQ